MVAADLDSLDVCVPGDVEGWNPTLYGTVHPLQWHRMTDGAVLVTVPVFTRAKSEVVHSAAPPRPLEDAPLSWRAREEEARQRGAEEEAARRARDSAARRREEEARVRRVAEEFEAEARVAEEAVRAKAEEGRRKVEEQLMRQERREAALATERRRRDEAKAEKVRAARRRLGRLPLDHAACSLPTPGSPAHAF
jgi:hypothetical protein